MCRHVIARTCCRVMSIFFYAVFQCSNVLVFERKALLGWLKEKSEQVDYVDLRSAASLDGINTRYNALRSNTHNESPGSARCDDCFFRSLQKKFDD